jgi:hypothetical protein
VHFCQCARFIKLIYADKWLCRERNVYEAIFPTRDAVCEFKRMLCGGFAWTLGGTVDKISSPENEIELIA